MHTSKLLVLGIALFTTVGVASGTTVGNASTSDLVDKLTQTCLDTVDTFHNNDAVGYDNEPEQVANFTLQELYDIYTNFWAKFIRPNNAMHALNDSTLMAHNVEGYFRTEPVVGRLLNSEFAFGTFHTIANNPEQFSLLGLPISFEVKKFVGNGNFFRGQVEVVFNISSLDLILPVLLSTMTTVNSKKQIVDYKLKLDYDYYAFKAMTDAAAKKYKQGSLQETASILIEKLTESICDTADTYCTGNNKQYRSQHECLSHLMALPLGNPGNAGSNNLLCRMIHQNLVPLRPDAHCSALGAHGDVLGYCGTGSTENFDGFASGMAEREPFGRFLMSGKDAMARQGGHNMLGVNYQRRDEEL